MNWLITGGAGFIGCNMAAGLSERGHEVTVLDNLSRTGTRENLEWLRSQWQVDFVEADVRDYEGLRRVLSDRPGIDVVAHEAAQVAVTTSVADPRHDFEVNALGTFNVLEACRERETPPLVLFASTNKVYGGLHHREVRRDSSRYVFESLGTGVREDESLDFHSPYGCSKGAADQYVRDYHRIYDVPTVVFRQSCIYGERQFGVEDQGWVAWFLIAALLERDITIYGDGYQARDLLHVADLVDAYELAAARAADVAGEVFNIGGGPENVLSLRELLELVPSLLGKTPRVRAAEWRPGDQPLFVSDNRDLERKVGWKASVGVQEGIERLARWILKNEGAIRRVLERKESGA